MKKLILLSTFVLTQLSWGALMQYETIGSTNPGFFYFTIDGIAHQRLLCDEFFPNVSTTMYNSVVVTLADIFVDNAGARMTTLRKSGVSSSTALLFYSYVAYLDAKAYDGSASASDVVLANRWMIDGLKSGKSGDFIRGGTAAGSGPLTNNAMTLLTEVQSQVRFPVYSGFRIYTSPLDATGARLTQEQTGFVEGAGGAVAEPSSLLLFGCGLLSIAYYRKSKTQSALNQTITQKV
jgi:hypothetical protein